jgi:hypothetical protein
MKFQASAEMKNSQLSNPIDPIKTVPLYFYVPYASNDPIA